MVSRGMMRITIEAKAHTRIASHHLITAPISGRFTPANIDVGSKLQEKQWMGDIQPFTDQPTANKSIQFARSQLANALKQIKSSKQQLDAAKHSSQQSPIRPKGTTPSKHELSQVDQINADTRTAKDNLLAAEFAIKLAMYEWQMSNQSLQLLTSDTSATEILRLFAPVDSTLMTQYHNKESNILFGDPLFEIGNPSKLEIVINTDSTELEQLSPGPRMWIKDWGGDYPLQGIIRRIEWGPSDEGSQLIGNIISHPDMWQTLSAGQTVAVSIIAWQGDDVTQVAKSSLVKTSSGWGVYKMNSHTRLLVPVIIGMMGPRNVQIIKGLSDGDLVFTAP